MSSSSTLQAVAKLNWVKPTLIQVRACTVGFIYLIYLLANFAMKLLSRVCYVDVRPPSTMAVCCADVSDSRIPAWPRCACTRPHRIRQDCCLSATIAAQYIADEGNVICIGSSPRAETTFLMHPFMLCCDRVRVYATHV
jgi:hypothetical protein